MVKAVGNTAEQKGDDIVDMIPLLNETLCDISIETLFKNT